MDIIKAVVIGIDDICRIFKDYAYKIGFPADAVPVKLMLNKQEHKLGLVVESAEFKPQEHAEEIKFDLRRYTGVQ